MVMHWSLGSKDTERLPSDLISLTAKPIEPSPVTAVVRLATANKEKLAELEKQRSADTQDVVKQVRHFTLQENNTIIHYPITNFADESIFNFEKVYDVGVPLVDIHKSLSESVLKDIYDGYDVSIISYGEAGSGKSFTLFGNEDSDGIIALTFQDIIQKKRELEKDQNTIVNIQISALEISLEKVYDMLHSADDRKPLKSHHETKKFGLYYQEANNEYINSIKEFDKVMKLIQDNKEASEKKMDSKRSTSHVVIRCSVEQLDRVHGTITSSNIMFADLCGSNRFEKDVDQKLGVENIKKLNLSISNLESVVNSVLQNQQKNHLYIENKLVPSVNSSDLQRIPYKDSQLTGLIQEALGGNSRTRVVLNCFDDKSHHEETIATLRFGVQLQNILNFVRADVTGLNSKKTLDLLIDNMKVIENNYDQRITLLESELNKLADTVKKAKVTEELETEIVEKNDEIKKLREQLETMTQLFNNIDPKESEDTKKIIQTLMEKCESVAQLQLELEGQLHENSILKGDGEIKDAKIRTLETMNSRLVEQLQNQESSTQDILKSNGILKKELEALSNISKSQQEKIKILEAKLRDSVVISSTESSPRKGSVSSSSINTMLPIDESDGQSKSWGFVSSSSKTGNFWGGRKVSTSSMTTITSQDSFQPKPLKKGFSLNTVKPKNEPEAGS